MSEAARPGRPNPFGGEQDEDDDLPRFSNPAFKPLIGSLAETCDPLDCVEICVCMLVSILGCMHPDEKNDHIQRFSEEAQEMHETLRQALREKGKNETGVTNGALIAFCLLNCLTLRHTLRETLEDETRRGRKKRK